MLKSGVGEAERADAIVSLGGDPGNRAEYAIKAFHRYSATQIVFTGLDGSGRKNPSPFPDLRGLSAAANQIPLSAIVYDTRPLNTWEEAETIVLISEQHGWTHVLISTDSHHSFRVAWSVARFADAKRVRTRFTVVTDGPPELEPLWWTNKPGRTRVGNEALRVMRYVGVYAFGAKDSLRAPRKT